MKRFTAPTGSEDHAKLLAALKAEETQAVGYETSSEVTKHTEALDRYFGKPYGNEQAGRSKITTREIYETVAWTVPDILDIFAAGGRICDLEADDPSVENQIEDRADYLNYVFFKDNTGVLILHDFIFDSLLHPRGYVDVEWDSEPSYAGWEEYEGLSTAQVQALIDDQTTEIDPQSLKEGQCDVSEDYPDGICYALKARKRLRDGCCRIENVPPEDMFVNGRATSMAQARYKGRLIRWRRSVWKEHFPDMADEIQEYSAGDESTSVDTDERRQARFDDDQASYGAWATAANKAAEELTGRKEFLWYADPEGDDKAVLIRVYRLGDLILDVEEIDDDPFASAAAHRVPHRLQGLSIPEILGDLQRLKTDLTRALVDGTMQANVPRIGADKNAVNLDDLLNLDYGAVIRTDGSPMDKLMPIATPDLSASTLKALQWSDQVIEQRSGVTRHAQGLDPDSLNHTAKGIQLLQNAANAVKRLLARLIAVGVEEMMTKVDRTIMRSQKSERVVKLGKQWTRIDPRSWSPAMRVMVSVGLGTGAKDVQLAFLQMIQADQVAVVANYGPQNPSVTMQHLYNTVTEKLRIMGYTAPDKFFAEPKNPDGSPWTPQPQPSPDQKKMEGEMQLGQARLQMEQQSEQQRQQMEAQKAAGEFQIRQLESQAQIAADERSAQLKSESDARKASLDAEIARFEAEGRLAIAREEASQKMQLAWAQFEFEKAMQQQEFAFKREIEQEKLSMAAKGKKPNGQVNGSAGHTEFGGEPG